LRIGITTGDPAGIGPEISLRAVSDARVKDLCAFVLFGDASILQAQSVALRLPFDFEVISIDAFHSETSLPKRTLVDIPAGKIKIGTGSRECGEAAARNVAECARACISGTLAGMVTAPLNKKFLHEAGYSYPGHTEMLAHLAGVSSVAMAFLTERLKVVLTTIHMPLREAIRCITAGLILEKLQIALREFPRLGLACRRVAVAGMNPHAGEAGLLGAEEAEHIEPAIQEARRIYPETTIEGPVPADTLFYRAAQGEFDLVLALFHDQGLAPIKLLGFGEAVNVTLGLPFLRTSVDHGTAYDIAGKGIARPESMISAIQWALRLAGKEIR
jgi:4-hydroxythreonine-4-phosphate dehydrogenase